MPEASDPASHPVPNEAAEGGHPSPPSLLIRADAIAPFDRGTGVVTLPYVGRWNSTTNAITTGTTRFEANTGLPLHSHNVEESVLVVEGAATAVIDGDEFDLGPGDATWVPAGVPHCFRNRGTTPMTIYWVYGGRDVTRTITATGETFEHLSPSDRGTTRHGPRTTTEE